VGGWEISGGFEKDRVQRRDNISEEVVDLFIVSGFTLELGGQRACLWGFHKSYQGERSRKR
jgi:hypothetical protein